MIIDKLCEIQKKLNVPKKHLNKHHGYYHRKCEDILEEVKKYLGDCVLTLTDEIINIGERYYVKATARLSDPDAGIECTAYARETLNKKGMDESQVTGAASSYARKYALGGLLCLDDSQDDDSTNTHENNQKSNNQKTNKTRQEIIDLAREFKTLDEKEARDIWNEFLGEHFGVENIDELSEDQMKEFYDMYLHELNQVKGRRKS